MMTYFFIEFAYGRDLDESGCSNLRDNQLVGAPSWIWEEGYDIDAKVDDALAEKFGKDRGAAFLHGRCAYRQPMMLMLQSLLADRFNLKVRRLTRVGPVYALVVAKGGPRFEPSASPDSASTAQISTAVPQKRPPCPAGMACISQALSMDLLADRLSRIMQNGRPVIDQTGLKGGYDIKLRFSRELSPSANTGTGMAPPLGPSGPSIFEALQQQLGLKLVPTKGPMEYLVIDHIERPTEN